MWFKNLHIYRLPAPWACAPEQLEAALAPHVFVPASSNELIRQGWASPRDNGMLVHTVNKQMLLVLGTDKKLLPSSVINQVARVKAAELAEVQGFAPGKKAMKELKERVADELLPRAFPVRTNTHVWIDPVNGWLVVNAVSPARADDVIKLLLKAVDRMPLDSLRVQRSPVAVMTAWLETDEAPVGFTVDKDATLRATGESKAEVGFKRHTLEPDDVRRHIAAGKQCARLALTWSDKISFVLTDSLAIKGIKALDVIKEAPHHALSDDAERFDNDMMLMTGELSKMLADLVEALGGFAAA
ncbi:MAG: recombination-associated protein RdgC [Pseudomonadota bacterium]